MQCSCCGGAVKRNRTVTSAAIEIEDEIPWRLMLKRLEKVFWMGVAIDYTSPEQMMFCRRQICKAARALAIK
jgi:hypothetical protein